MNTTTDTCSTVTVGGPHASQSDTCGRPRGHDGRHYGLYRGWIWADTDPGGDGDLCMETKWDASMPMPCGLEKPCPVHDTSAARTTPQED